MMQRDVVGVGATHGSPENVSRENESPEHGPSQIGPGRRCPITIPGFPMVIALSLLATTACDSNQPFTVAPIAIGVAGTRVPFSGDPWVAPTHLGVAV